MVNNNFKCISTLGLCHFPNSCHPLFGSYGPPAVQVFDAHHVRYLTPDIVKGSHIVSEQFFLYPHEGSSGVI